MAEQGVGGTRRGLMAGAPLAALAGIVVPSAFVPDSDAAEPPLWTRHYEAHKGDVTLALYRKRLGAAKFRPYGAGRRRILADERFRSPGL